MWVVGFAGNLILWVVGLKGNQIPLVVGVKQKCLQRPPYIFFWNSPNHHSLSCGLFLCHGQLKIFSECIDFQAQVCDFFGYVMMYYLVSMHASAPFICNE